jgi:FkbM family methyltransferase
MMLRKSATLIEILGYPKGLRLKLTDRSFEPGPFRVCSRLRDAGIAPRTVFDVGANVGQFALAATTLLPGTPAIHSYEPTRDPFLQLRSLSTKRKNVTAHMLALGAQAGRENMLLASDNQASSFLPLGAGHKSAYPGIEVRGEETVDVSTLEAEVARLDPAGPMLLKLDVQGSEAQVLDGAGEALSRFDWVVLETSTFPMYAGQVLFDGLDARLRAAGFAFTYPVDIHLGRDGAVCQFDALFTRRGVSPGPGGRGVGAG